jgi:4-hydroxybenzoate polyprenyltransferase
MKITGIMGILYGMGIPKGSGWKNKLLGFVCMQRPAIAVMGPLMFFAAASLAIGKIPSWEELLFGSIAVYLLTASEHFIDDTIDIEIDKVKWPTRPLPSEVLTRKTGGLYAISLAAMGIILSYILFNWQVVAVELFALGLGTVYPFLRDRLGYLILAPIPPLIGVGGWVAYSPDTLFSSPVPWILYLIFAFWQAFHILTLPYAINVAKTLIVRPKPRTIVILSVLLSVITLGLIVYLSYFIENSLIFLTVMAVMSIVFWISMIPLISEPSNMQSSLIATMVATDYNIAMCLILILFVG